MLTKGRNYMTKLLIKLFVKEYEDVDKVSVRTAYGVLSSMVGIFCNAFLFIVKVCIALFTGSVAVMADAFNNLSDAGTSVIGFGGMKIAEMPADGKHPFGHGRMEYITALVVSFIVINVGFTCFRDAFMKIIHPEDIYFHALSVVLLLLSILVKFWLGAFNKKLGEKIDSQVMLATAADSKGDAIATMATVAAMFVYKFTGINIDGLVGIGVSIVVMLAGIDIAKDTLNSLIGEPVTAKTCAKIEEFVESHDKIQGCHDLIVHDYGPGRSMASIHVELSNELSLVEAHEIADRIEREAEKTLGMNILIHMDPVELKDKKTIAIREMVEKMVEELDEKCTIHDFQVIEEEEVYNLLFDLVIPREYKVQRGDEIMTELMRRLHRQDKRYCCVITLEQSFIEE